MHGGGLTQEDQDGGTKVVKGGSVLGDDDLVNIDSEKGYDVTGE